MSLTILTDTLRAYHPPWWTVLCVGIAIGCVLMVLAYRLGTVL